MQLQFSFIIPVFNRPEEIKELLQSFLQLEGSIPFEIVIVEDGSTVKSDEIIKTFSDKLNINYLYKENSGPGNSRNYGMRNSHGNYFIILDSDCLLPKDYLIQVNKGLEKQFVHCFGGPDAAHESFSNLQKAINFAMTSFLSTGGIRGSNKSINKFQPRSFNMGLSKEAFETTGGFDKVHPGEDPDLTLRLWESGYDTLFFEKAKVYHKRRISWGKFYKQVYKFGMVRPILNLWYPNYAKLTYWFPTFFSVGLIVSIVLSLFGFYWFLVFYAAYMVLYFFTAMFESKNLLISFQSLAALFIQMFGYGWGFLKSSFFIKFLKRKPEIQFPELFFN